MRLTPKGNSYISRARKAREWAKEVWRAFPGDLIGRHACMSVYGRKVKNSQSIVQSGSDWTPTRYGWRETDDDDTLEASKNLSHTDTHTQDAWGHSRETRELAGAVGEGATPCTDGRPSENTPPWLGLHQSSLPNAAKEYPPREPREPCCASVLGALGVQSVTSRPGPGS